MSTKGNTFFLTQIFEQLDRHEFGEDQFKQKIQEGLKFIKFIENGIENLKDKVAHLENEVSRHEGRVSDLETELGDIKEVPELFEELEDLLKIGGLKVGMEVEEFVNNLKLKNGLTPATKSQLKFLCKH